MSLLFSPYMTFPAAILYYTTDLSHCLLLNINESIYWVVNTVFVLLKATLLL